jgi:hypothetical protein
LVFNAAADNSRQQTFIAFELGSGVAFFASHWLAKVEIVLHAKIDRCIAKQPVICKLKSVGTLFTAIGRFIRHFAVDYSYLWRLFNAGFFDQLETIKAFAADVIVIGRLGWLVFGAVGDEWEALETVSRKRESVLAFFALSLFEVEFETVLWIYEALSVVS